MLFMLSVANTSIMLNVIIQHVILLKVMLPYKHFSRFFGFVGIIKREWVLKWLWRKGLIGLIVIVCNVVDSNRK